MAGILEIRRGPMAWAVARTHACAQACARTFAHTHTCVGVSGVGSWSAALDDGTMIASGVTDLASPWPAAEGGSGATSVS